MELRIATIWVQGLVVILLGAAPVHSQQAPLGSVDDVAGEIQELRNEIADLRNQIGRQATAATDLLPPPVDPQRLLWDDVVRAGNFRGAVLLPGTDISLRIDGYARGDVMYDTGFVGTGIQLFPTSIALDGSPQALRRGQTQLTGSQSRLSFDAQAKTDIGRLRGYVELDFLKDNTDPRLRHVFGEWKGEYDELLGGQTWSTFMDPAALPSVIPETTAAGAIFRRQPQFRYTRRITQGTSLAVAVENPLSTDFTLPDPATDARLARWPDFVARIRFEDPELGAIQLASLVRGIGYEDALGDEHFQTGWGVSMTGRLQVANMDNIRGGVAGGQGVGGYLAGLGGDLSAAGPDTDGFHTLGTIGVYLALQHFWTEHFRSTAYYGYSHVASTPLMPLTAGKDIHNGGINLMWSPRAGFGVGIEYAYGLREVRDGTSGDNHRIQFGVQFGP